MGVSRRTSPLNGGTPCLPALPPVPPAHQWATTTSSRIPTDPYSWMQAVHWIHSAGIAPTPKCGPRFGDTTVRVARLLADLTPCRPSVAYIARRLDLSERTVKYHLAHLRGTGLLAYAVKGSRRKGATPLASEFVRVIPPVFDEALGIRTVGEGAERRVVGIAEHGRKLIAKLAKKAARKVRRPRTRAASAGRGRCTPMEGGTCTSSAAGTTRLPSEDKLASGKPKSPTPKKPTRGQHATSKQANRKLNKVGRRHQLARELTARVYWLRHAHPDRIAWTARHVADAGWSADEVIAWLNLGADPQAVYRPSGFLARRLKAAHTTWTSAETRRRAVAEDREARRIAAARHDEIRDGLALPASRSVAARVMDGIRRGLDRYATHQAAHGLDNLAAPAQSPASDDDTAAAFAAFLGTDTPEGA